MSQSRGIALYARRVVSLPKANMDALEEARVLLEALIRDIKARSYLYREQVLEKDHDR